jgi:PKD repeat protein
MKLYFGRMVGRAVFLWTLLFFVAVPLLSPSPSSACTDPGTCSSFTIGSYSLVSQKKVTSTTYEYTYRASLTNSSPAIGRDITATATSKVSGVTLSDRSLFFGESAANSTIQSTNTFSIRSKAGYVVKASDLSWYVNGSTIPIADAGPDQTVTLPSGKTSMTVQLNGSGSVDICGNVTKYAWSGKPNPSDVMKPSVSLSAGTYVFSLIVMDNGYTWSAPSTVTITVKAGVTNKAPTVSAGSAQTITLPATASITGTATDDGLPVGSTLTTTWSKSSGSGTVTFGNASALATTASFSTAGSYVLRLTASDGALSSSATVTITVNAPANQIPIANAGPDQTVTIAVGQTTIPVQLNGSASSDPDGTIASYTWTGTPTPAASAQPSVTLAAGTYTFSLVVTDNKGATSPSDSVTITVNAPANQIPIANAGPDQTVTIAVGQTTIPVQLNGSASSDPDGTIASYTWTGTPTPAASAQPSVTLAAGTYTFSLVVTDNKGATSPSDSVTITVNATVNQAPTVNAGSPQTISFPNNVGLSGSASDDGLPAGSKLTTTWTKVNGPGTVAFTNASALSTAASFSKVGAYTLRLTASDGALSSSSDVAITVSPVLPPTVVVNPLVYSIDQDQPLAINVSGNKADGSVVTLAAKPLVANATFSATSGAAATGTFEFTPDSSQVGQFMVAFTARDQAGLTDTKTVQITVGPVNHAPVISLPATASVLEGKSLMIKATASDPDGDTLTFSPGTALPANASIVASTGTIMFRPGSGQASQSPYAVTVTATDNKGLSASATINITVTAAATGGGTGPWDFTVDPVESPTFLTKQRITGTVGSGTVVVVEPAKSALITGMSPAIVEQGTTQNVVLTGDAGSYATHFAQGNSKADFGSGVTVNSVTVAGPTQATVNITVAGNAGVGARSANVVTGSETAVSIVAFSVAKGKATITGKVVDSATGNPLAGAIVTIQGTTITAITGADGTFTLNDAPSGQQVLLINAQNHSLIQTTVDAQTGVQEDLGDMKTESTVFDANSAPAVSLGSLISRVYIGPNDKRTVEDLKQTVIDAVQFVGGKDLGVTDEYGNELNPSVTDDTPFFRLNSSAVETIAMRAKFDRPITLGELLLQFTYMFQWKEDDGYGKPNLNEWIVAIQNIVDAAWANPNDPASRLFVLLFNNDKYLKPQAPRISPDFPLNELQASLMRFTLFALGTRAIDPRDILQELPPDYYGNPAVDETTGQASSASSVLLAALANLGFIREVASDVPALKLPGTIVLAQNTPGGGTGSTGLQMVARAAKKKENAFIGKNLLLDGTSSDRHGVPVTYKWDVMSFTPSDPSDTGHNTFVLNHPSQSASYTWNLDNSTLIGARQWIINFQPNAAGEFKVQLTVTQNSDTSNSSTFEITIVARHWPCDPRGLDVPWETTEVTSMDRPWQNVLCDVAAKKSVDIGKTELTKIVQAAGGPSMPTSAYQEWITKGTIAGDVTARLNAEKNFLRFFQNDSAMTSVIKENAKVYEKYLPQIMAASKTQPPTVTAQIKGFVGKELITGALSYFKDEADKLGSSIMYAVLDKMIDGVIKSVRPSPPFISRVELVSADYDTSTSKKKLAFIYFSRSSSDPGPDEKTNGCAGDSKNTNCNADFFYRVVRESNGQTVKFGIYPESDNAVNGVVATGEQTSGEPLLFVDYNPPEGHVRYYVQARRIIGQHTVPSEVLWSDAEFFLTNYVIGSVCPPAAAEYNFTKGMMERFYKILTEIKLQDSDLSEPEIVYVPKPYEVPTPPVSIAVDPFKQAYVGIPLTSSVFKLRGGELDFAFNTGFADPFQVGLAIDAAGTFYSVNGASQEQYGGRIFRWSQGSYIREFFGSVQYYSRELGYAQPTSAISLFAGLQYGQQKLFLTDAYSNTLRSLVIPPNGGLPPGDLYHNVSQPLANVTASAAASMTIRQGADLLLTQGDNIFRYGSGPGDTGNLFPPAAKPFKSLSGIDSDRYGNLYVADGTSGTITALPQNKQNDFFYADLADTGKPEVRDLYTLVSSLTSPGDIRVAGHGSALVWFDRSGFSSRQFGLSMRIVDTLGYPVTSAQVVAEGVAMTSEGETDEYGVVHLPGLLSADSPPPSISVFIRDSLGRTMTIRVGNMAQQGETFIDPLVFIADEIPVPTSYVQGTPPKPTTLIPGALVTEVDPGGLPVGPNPSPGVPRIELVVPVDGLQTKLTQTDILGIVSDRTISQVALNINGTVQTVPVNQNTGRFTGTMALNAGINSITASATSTVTGQPVSSSSATSYVQQTSATPMKTTLSGLVVDQATGYPVAKVRVIVEKTALFTYTDALGVWSITDVPVGTYTVQVAP